MIKNILNLRRIYKKIIIISNDFFLNLSSSFLLLVFLFDTNYNYLPFLILPLILFLPLFLLSDLYNNILRYSGFRYYFKIISSSLLYLFIYILIFNYFYQISIKFLIFQPILFFIFILFSRSVILLIFSFYRIDKTKKNIIIYGAGEAGYKSLKLLKNIYNIICIVDDDLSREKETLNG